MARETIEILTDDLNGGDAAETVSFALDGVEYEIDLNRRNASAFRKSLTRYVKAGRRVGGRKRRTATNSTSSSRDYDLQELRAWAKRKRVKVPARGRIPRDVVERYRADGGR